MFLSLYYIHIAIHTWALHAGVDCGALLSIAMGSIHLLNESTVYSSLAAYACMPGHQLVGVVMRVCQSDGQWSDTPPLCISDGTSCIVIIPIIMYNYVYS